MIKMIEAQVVEAKKDERGRKITSKSEREEQVRLYRGSGLTQRAYAQRERINYSTFISWVQEFPVGKSGGVHFSEVAASVVRSTVGLEARLPDGIVVRGEAAEVARLLQLLRC